MAEINFKNIINNTATESEKNDFYRMIENDPQKLSEYQDLKNLHFISQYNKDQYQKQQSENFEKFWNKVQNSGSNRTINLWMKYAAIIITALLLGFFTNQITNKPEKTNNAQQIEYSSEKGSISKISLEDGSIIWLSTSSKLVLHTNEKGEIVASLSGEAYFDLIPDSKRNFIVDLGLYKVRDIGTKFNIRNYESEKTISTALIDGKIELLNKSDKAFLTVNPGELIQYDKLSKKITINQYDNSITTAWKDGKFVFIDKTLEEICEELENWYNIEIQIDDEKLSKTKYTSVVKRSTTVQMVLKILSITDQIKYEITEKKEGKDLIKIRK